MNGLQAALAAARRGWAVFPLRYRDKRPAVQDWEHWASADPSVIARKWPSSECNAGIACGPSGLVIIDLDPPDGARRMRDLCERRKLPATFTVSTPREGGIQIYFTTIPGLEIRNSAGKIAPNIDIRAAGGYVVAPGSVLDQRAYSNPVTLANNGRYIVLDGHRPAPVPGWLADLATRRPEPHTPGPVQPVQAPTAYGQAALAGECALLAAMAPDTGRNHQLNASAFKLGRLVHDGIIGQEAIVTGLMRAARECRLVADDGEPRCMATIASGLGAGMANPRQAVMAR